MLSGSQGFEDGWAVLRETTALPGMTVFEGEAVVGHTPVIDRFFEHWRGKLRGETLPTRADLVPRELGRHLPHAVLMDVVETPGAFAAFCLRVRLIGSHVAESYGEITGKDISEMANRAAARRIYRMSELAIERRAPVLSHVGGFAPGREHMAAFALYMPLAADGEGVGQMFVAVDVRPIDAAD